MLDILQRQFSSLVKHKVEQSQIQAYLKDKRRPPLALKQLVENNSNR